MNDDPLAAFRQYELQSRQDQIAKKQHLFDEQEHKKKEAESQQLLREQARAEFERRQAEERRLAEQVSHEMRQYDEDAQNHLLTRSAAELRQANERAREAQLAAIKRVQESQKPRAWTSRDGREFQSPREAEFWDEWASDEERAKSIPLIPQYQIGRYRVDFAHLASKTAIELDGRGFHIGRYTFTNDRVRQRTLEKQGWRFIRFSGDEISADVEGRVREVCEFIHGR